MSLLDYYKQFEGMTEEEVNAGLREEALERKRKALARVETLDLSQTTWPELPHPSIVSAITFVARRGMHRYPHQQRGSQLHHELAERHGVEPGRIILGNGAAELLSSATRALIEPGQRLLSPWPSYPLYPIMARRAHGRAVPVSGGVDELLAEIVAEPGTRVIAIASPNDPTGELLATAELQRLLAGLPGNVVVLLDESLVEFSDAQPVNSSIELLAEHSRLFVFRSFSKAWGLAGLRVGYAIGGPGSEELLAELQPDLGVSEVSQAGALEALQSCTEIVTRRVSTIAHERATVTAGLREREFDVTDSQTNFVWAAHPAYAGRVCRARELQLHGLHGLTGRSVDRRAECISPSHLPSHGGLIPTARRHGDVLDAEFHALRLVDVGPSRPARLRRVGIEGGLPPALLVRHPLRARRLEGAAGDWAAGGPGPPRPP